MALQRPHHTHTTAHHFPDAGYRITHAHTLEHQQPASHAPHHTHAPRSTRSSLTFTAHALTHMMHARAPCSLDTARPWAASTRLSPLPVPSAPPTAKHPRAPRLQQPQVEPDVPYMASPVFLRSRSMAQLTLLLPPASSPHWHTKVTRFIHSLLGHCASMGPAVCCKDTTTVGVRNVSCASEACTDVHRKHI